MVRYQRTITFGRKLARHQSLLHFLAYLAVALGFIYFWWRFRYTYEGSNPWMFWALISCELFGFGNYLMFISDIWTVPEFKRPPVIPGKTDVLIPTYNEEKDILEATIIGSLELKGEKEIWILDDGNRAWLEELCSEYQIHYVARTEHLHAKAGNINNVLPLLKGDFILTLDADHIPMPSFIEATIGYFADPAVAIVQAPQDFRNMDSFQHYSAEIHEQSLFYDVIMPARDKFHSVFWCGSAAMLRRSALIEIGGVSTMSITEDFETSIKLKKAGYITKWHDEKLVYGLAPESLEAYLLQRDRWARGNLRVIFSKLSPFTGGAYSFRAKLGFLSTLTYHLIPLQQIIYISILVISLLTNQLPIAEKNARYLWLWFPFTILTLVTIPGFSRGRETSISGRENTWLVSYIHMKAVLTTLIRGDGKFKVTPKDSYVKAGFQSLPLLTLPIIFSTALAVSVFLRLTALYIGKESGHAHLLPDESLTVTISLTCFAIYQLSAIYPVIYRLITRHQYRSTWRFPVSLKATVGHDPATVVDMHENGVRLQLHHTQHHPKKRVYLEIEIPIEGEKEFVAKGFIVNPRIQRSEDEGIWQMSGHVEWIDRCSRREVMKQCYVRELSRVH